MTVTRLSAAALREELLEPTLEAQAVNAVQQRALCNPTPGHDSLVADLVALRRHGVPLDLLHDIVARVRLLIEANGVERDCERAIAAVADELARVQHADELASRSPGVKALATQLRGPLGCLQRPDGVHPLVLLQAAREIDAVIEKTGLRRLTSASLRNELGPGKHDLVLAAAMPGTPAA